MSKRWRRDRSGVRVGVDRRCHDFGHFPAQSGPMEGQVLQLAWLASCCSHVAEKRQSGTEYHEPEFLTWRGEGSCLNGTRRKHSASSSLRATRPVSSVLLT